MTSAVGLDGNLSGTVLYEETKHVGKGVDMYVQYYRNTAFIVCTQNSSGNWSSITLGVLLFLSCSEIFTKQ